MTALLFLLISGVIADDFLVEPDLVKGFQVAPVVAVAPNGNFAVAWEDSLWTEFLFSRSDVYIRFFDKNGNPLTPSIQLDEDTFAARPRLSVDEAGRFVCTWTEQKEVWGPVDLWGRVFDETGNPLTEKFLVVPDSAALRGEQDVGCASSGFFVVWQGANSFWGQRFDSLGNSLEDRVVVYDQMVLNEDNHSVGVSPSGNAVAAWHWSGTYYDPEIRFQIVDADNNLVKPDSFSLITDSELRELHRRPCMRWLDDERCAIFLLKSARFGPEFTDTVRGVQVKLFDAQGDSLSGILTLVHDPCAATGTKSVPLAVSSIHNGLYAVGYQRGFDGPGFRYYRAAGFLADTSFKSVTGIFRLSETEPHYYQQEASTCVDASDDRIVWVWKDNTQKREHGDTINITDPYYSDIHCKITDWDIVGIEEQPASRPTNWEIGSAVGSEIVLRYSDCPEGFHAAIYDVTGCKIDEVRVEGSSGSISWGEGHGPGVYFIREALTQATHRVALVR